MINLNYFSSSVRSVEESSAKTNMIDGRDLIHEGLSKQRKDSGENTTLILLIMLLLLLLLLLLLRCS